MWNELTILWNDLTTERNDRKLEIHITWTKCKLNK